MLPTPPTSPQFRTPQQSPPRDVDRLLRSPVSPTRLNSLRLTPDCENELLVPVTCKIVEREGSSHYKCASVAMTGFRETMEDAHVMMCNNGEGFFGVFDGHGGSHCSSFCASRFPEEIKKNNLPFDSTKFEEITLSIDEQYCLHNPVGGSTAAMFISTPSAESQDRYDVQIANVGDSRVIICSGNRIRFATADHKPNLIREKARIEKYGGIVRGDRVDGRLAMSRAMGDREFKTGRPNPLERKITAQPDITKLDCDKDEMIIVACDGIFENGFDDQQVVDFVIEQIKTTADLGKVVARLCDEALRRGSSDNMTAMIVQFRDGRNFRSTKEFVPGPYHPQNHENFRSAYSDMVRKAGVSWESALDMRYKQLCDELGTVLARPTGKVQPNKEVPMTHGDIVAELKEVRAERALPLTDFQQNLTKRIRELITPETYEQFCEQLTKAIAALTLELQAPTATPHSAAAAPPQSPFSHSPCRERPTQPMRGMASMAPHTPLPAALVGGSAVLPAPKPSASAQRSACSQLQRSSSLPPRPEPGTLITGTRSQQTSQLTNTVSGRASTPSPAPPPVPIPAPEAAARAAAAAQKASVEAAKAQATAISRSSTPTSHLPPPSQQPPQSATWNVVNTPRAQQVPRSPFRRMSSTEPRARSFTPDPRTPVHSQRRQSVGGAPTYSPATPRTPNCPTHYNIYPGLGQTSQTTTPHGYYNTNLPCSTPTTPSNSSRYHQTATPTEYDPYGNTAFPATPTTRRYSAVPPPSCVRSHSAPRTRSYSQPAEAYSPHSPAPTFHRQQPSQAQHTQQHTQAPTHQHAHAPTHHQHQQSSHQPRSPMDMMYGGMGMHGGYGMGGSGMMGPGGMMGGMGMGMPGMGMGMGMPGMGMGMGGFM